MAQKARNLLRHVDAKILGAVITNVSITPSTHYDSSFYVDPTHTVRSAHRTELN
jgi:hypothetical protein